jgi:hypothetical protein
MDADGDARNCCMTIFYPNTILHDGGVVVRGDRWWRRAAYFRCRRSPELSKSLGTRHRAAIGLTEESDALVVVVSEETGSTSPWPTRDVCGSGLDSERLERILSAVLLKRRTGVPKAGVVACAPLAGPAPPKQRPGAGRGGDAGGGVPWHLRVAHPRCDPQQPRAQGRGGVPGRWSWVTPCARSPASPRWCRGAAGRAAGSGLGGAGPLGGRGGCDVSRLARATSAI